MKNNKNNKEILHNIDKAMQSIFKKACKNEKELKAKKTAVSQSREFKQKWQAEIEASKKKIADAIEEGITLKIE